MLTPPQGKQSSTSTASCMSFSPHCLKTLLPPMKYAVIRARTWVTRDGCLLSGQSTPREPCHPAITHSLTQVGMSQWLMKLYAQIPTWVLFFLNSHLRLHSNYLALWRNSFLALPLAAPAILSSNVRWPLLLHTGGSLWFFRSPGSSYTLAPTRALWGDPHQQV